MNTPEGGEIKFLVLGLLDYHLLFSPISMSIVNSFKVSGLQRDFLELENKDEARNQSGMPEISGQ